MAKIGGLCLDPRTKQWRACGGNISTTGSTGGEPPCCLNRLCCLDCDDLNAIRVCFQRNLEIFLSGDTFVDGTIGASQLVRQWRGQSNFPGGCSNWVPQDNAYPTGLLHNGELVDCYNIVGDINGDTPITPGSPLPVGLIFETTDPDNCQDFAIFLLVDSVDLGNGDWGLNVISSKYCINYTEITDEASYRNDCYSCNTSQPPQPTCQILAENTAAGGIGSVLNIDLGVVVEGTNPTINYITIIIPDCCTEEITDANFSTSDLGGFANVISQFTPEPPPNTPGVYSTLIRLINASGRGPGTTTVTLNTTACGSVTINFNYEIVSP